MKTKLILIIFFLLFLSRIIFLSISPGFFDAPEYLKLFQNSSLIRALEQVHYPIHPLYIAVGWIFNKLPLGSSLLKQELLNSIFGLLSLILIFKICRGFLKENISLVITAASSFLPYFWLSQINVLYEPLLCLLLLTSFYFLVEWMKTEKNKFIHLSALFFSLSFLVSSTALIYLVFFFGFLWAFKKLKSLVTWFPILFFYLSLALGVYLYILSLREISWQSLYLILTSGNGILPKLQSEGIMFFARLLKNSLIVYFNYLTIPVGTMTVMIALFDFYHRRNRKIILFWLASFLLLNCFWHAGMYGRLSLALTLFPLVYFTKIKNKYITAVLLIFLFIVSIRKVFPYHFYKVPDIVEKEYVENFPGSPLLVVGNLEEPFLCEKLSCVVLNSPSLGIDEAEKQINFALFNKRPVLITSQAISAPYFQYDGANFQILSTRKSHPQTDGEKLVKKYFLQIVKQWSKYKMTIYLLQEAGLCQII